jgi:hypothetical protein
MNLPLRVLVGGHTGLRKNVVLDNVRNYIVERQKNLKVEVYSIEKYFSVSTFVDASPEKQAAVYLDALERVLRDISVSDADVAFLSMHCSFYSAGFFLSPFALNLGQRNAHTPYFFELLRKKFDPDYIITLIDDIAATKARIIDKGFQIQAQELLAWRDIELMTADTLATVLISKTKRRKDLRSRRYERSMLVSIRQSPSLIYKYLFEPNVPRIYLSFRITGTRNDRKAVGEIDRFRQAMSDRYAVFDPLAIDDIPLLEMASQVQNQDDVDRTYTFPSERRWLVEAKQTMVDEASGIQVEFSREELN